MPAKELSPEQLAEAAHLKVLFKVFQDERKAANEPWQQDALSEEFGFGQSALSQYLNGTIPLNLEAVEKFSQILDVPAFEISPTVVQRARETQKRVAALLGRKTRRAPAKSTGSKKS